ncbi:MAG: ECF-type sigma factor [Pirellulaceae bacterium]|nr:hypothetical protein [Planctomycetales bacterium]
MSLESENSVTAWLENLRADDQDAAAKLWERYFHPLLSRADRRFGARSRLRAAGPEDAVADAIHSVFRRYQRGELSEIRDRDGLWRLLMTVTDRKCSNLVRRETAAKRGGGRVHAASNLQPENAEHSDVGGPLDYLASGELSPDAHAAVTETFDHLLQILHDHDPELVAIATSKMEGWKNEEIAEQLGRSVATVERRLKLIRELWQAFDGR